MIFSVSIENYSFEFVEKENSFENLIVLVKLGVHWESVRLLEVGLYDCTGGYLKIKTIWKTIEEFNPTIKLIKKTTVSD